MDMKSGETRPGHLAERLAERLRARGGLAGSELLFEPAAAEAAGGLTETAPSAKLDGLSPPAAGAAIRPGEAPSGRPAPDPRTVGMDVLEKAGMLSLAKGRTRVSEEFRIAQGQILRLLTAPQGANRGLANLLMVTSAKPGEGKSFASLNLAMSIARWGGRGVVLTDCDSKVHSLSERLGLLERPGVLDIASGAPQPIGEMVVPTDIPGLGVLPIGKREDHRDQIAAGRPISLVVERIARTYPDRVVVLDAPPCLASSDPSMLAPLVGQTVLIVEAEKTQRSEVESALEFLQSCENVTLLLNKVQLTASHTFGAYGAYGVYP